MPWKETDPVKERFKMVCKWEEGEQTIAELSREYGVSRKTIYKWTGRYKEFHVEGLKDRPRAPNRRANKVSPAIEDRVVKAKDVHKRWGPKKITVWLKKQAPGVKWPAVSTVGEILKRNGLVKARRKRKRTPPYTQPFLECAGPNAVWSADYKGEFRLGDGKLCYPLTVTDNFSRYVFACRGFQRIETGDTRGCFERVFREHGLPDAIKTDNGAPFASRAVGGLSRLSVWFIKLGIWPERIAAGCPEQNGRHERMHLTLKDEVAMPPEKNLKEQQRSFDRFLYEFNHERPHEALEQKVPGEVYKSSHRRYPCRISEVEYDGGIVVRRVRSNGEIKWRGGHVFVSEVLVGERIGLRQVDDDLWELFYSFYPLGRLNEKTRKIEPCR